ncbi:50S ribosomal protein L29 [Mycoplasma sp. 'Moose RK']|uniref:50S ribosomal protein L29 n=1 Tax=Mycoplasma sp. 'Moose RK' TaxID=2780095 RepID=UPI0018C343E8|nr:50S ribosomal protein L29 [Mycoplasma sp. 'Moose RK']MBG0730821.1 50S ribosomal protein L29 [Mycoplasma sp. 'Moose RK']
MEFKELLKKTPTELNSLLLEYRSELFILRFKNQSSNLDQTHKIAKLRKIIARILTIMNQQKLLENPKPKKVKCKKTRKLVNTAPTSLKAHFKNHIKPLLKAKPQFKSVQKVERQLENE